MSFRPVYSVQLLSVAPALPSQTVVVPTGVRIILRDIDAWAAASSTTSFLLVYNAAGGIFIQLQVAAGAGSGSVQWTGRQVFNPGESIRFQASSGSWNIQASGYELTLT